MNILTESFTPLISNYPTSFPSLSIQNSHIIQKLSYPYQMILSNTPRTRSILSIDQRMDPQFSTGKQKNSSDVITKIDEDGHSHSNLPGSNGPERSKE